MAYTINLDPVLTLASAASFETLLDLGIQLHSIKLYLDRSRLYSSIHFRFFFFFFKYFPNQFCLEAANQLEMSSDIWLEMGEPGTNC